MQKRRSGSRRLLVSLPLISLLFLSGCVTDGNCKFLPLREYDDGFKRAFAIEVGVIPAESATIQFVADSIQLRDAVRACKGND